MSIRMQADDFFGAYEVLKENDSALIANLTGLKGKPLVSKKAFGARPTMTPKVVCLAFSIELYLKEIYLLLDLKIPRGKKGHDIYELFSRLPEGVRLDIFNYKGISQNSFFTRGSSFSIKRFSKDFTSYDGFLENLSLMRNSFVEWRYAHESCANTFDEGLALAFIKGIKITTEKILKNQHTNHQSG